MYISQHRESKNGAYYLSTEEGGVAHTYCHMENIPSCGGGGWTLVMKIDGAKVRLKNKHAYVNIAKTFTSLKCLLKFESMDNAF